MNKDQIMRAVENASEEQLEQIAAIVDAAPIQVPITERHVGCVVKIDERPLVLDVVEPCDLDSVRYEGGRFLNPYRVPITHRWSGGKQPVADDALVLVQFRDGSFEMRHEASLDWFHCSIEPVAGDIIGYTVLDVIGVEDE